MVGQLLLLKWLALRRERRKSLASCGNPRGAFSFLGMCSTVTNINSNITRNLKTLRYIGHGGMLFPTVSRLTQLPFYEMDSSLK